MTVTVDVVPYEDKAVLRRLVELYVYDFSEFTREDVNEHGEFGYRYLDHYWADSPDDRRFPFFIRVDGKLAGFALVRTRDGRGHSMAEFFVMRKYRRTGAGSAAAQDVFGRFKGAWEVTELAANLPAQAFWRKVIGTFTGGAYREDIDPERVLQKFTSA